MKRLIGLVFIIGGILTIFFPTLENSYYSSQENQLVSEFQSLDRVFAEVDEAELEGESTHTQESEDEAEITDQVHSVLTIEKLDLTLPVLHGATEENLKIGAGIMSDTTPLGEIGNTAIAAHRSHTYGRQFNRLDELESGDTIEIETTDGQTTYQVFEKVVVTPDDLSVLDPMGEQSVVTLITCDPMIDPTHRLIVHAKKIEDSSK
ncbi:class D sortase [Halalkalibacillus sediminis]|uniref:Class D sortase n=1 Tax=Halalkalibacillus sediminis TaxID=2018042 RepID=A0A2I0QSA9_9BACI|nr:class D sortase [Halalkalibacillus sediminis]PKR77198.1 class D sortase [Halalkalibacillus sediminis]